LQAKTQLEEALEKLKNKLTKDQKLNEEEIGELKTTHQKKVNIYTQ